MDRSGDEFSRGLADDGPGGSAGVDELKMIDGGDHSAHYRITPLSGEGAPLGRKLGGNLVVGFTLEEDLRDVEREQVSGVRGFVAFGKIFRTTAHKIEDFIAIVGEEIIAGKGDGKAEVNGPSQGDRAAEWDRGWLFVELTPGIDMMAAGYPEGEMTAGGMAHGEDAREIQRVGAGKLDEVIETGCGIVKGGRPAAASLADTTIFNRPAGKAFFPEGRAEMAGVAKIIFGLPPAAVVEGDDRSALGTTEAGQPQVAEMAGAGTVGDAVIG
jgi:hypothetical protein